MISDLITIMWKEAKEIVLHRPGFRGGWIGMLVFLGIFGIMLPLQSGPEWVESPLTLLAWAWVPFMLVNSVVADSIAGERERHTLETLLASRLSDGAILFGKIIASLLYGWGLTLISLVISLITLNLVHGEGELLMFSPQMIASILVLTLLVATLAAGLGVLVSLRASTVRQAQQTLSTAFFLLFIPFLLLPNLPQEWQARLAGLFMNANVSELAIGLGVALLVLDIGLLLAARARFRRARLILD